MAPPVCTSCQQPVSWTTECAARFSGNAHLLYRYARQLYLDGERYHYTARHNVWGCEECHVAGVISRPLTEDDLRAIERVINGYPVDGVSTPVTAADCNPHAEPPPVPHTSCDAQCEAELTTHGWTPCRCYDRRHARTRGFTTDCDPGDENTPRCVLCKTEPADPGTNACRVCKEFDLIG